MLGLDFGSSETVRNTVFCCPVGLKKHNKAALKMPRPLAKTTRTSHLATHCACLANSKPVDSPTSCITSRQARETHTQVLLISTVLTCFLGCEDLTMAPEGAFQVTVHPYNSPTRGSCAYEHGDTSSRNALIFIGGLSDGPHTTEYVRIVGNKLLRRIDLSYSVFEIRMRSSFNGFGCSSLKNDVEDISSLVRYLRGIGREKIVLMGHSTGCQV